MPDEFTNKTTWDDSEKREKRKKGMDPEEGEENSYYH